MHNGIGASARPLSPDGRGPGHSRTRGRVAHTGTSVLPRQRGLSAADLRRAGGALGRVRFRWVRWSAGCRAWLCPDEGRQREVLGAASLVDRPRLACTGRKLRGWRLPHWATGRLGVALRRRSADFVGRFTGSTNALGVRIAPSATQVGSIQWALPGGPTRLAGQPALLLPHGSPGFAERDRFADLPARCAPSHRSGPDACQLVSLGWAANSAPARSAWRVVGWLPSAGGMQVGRFAAHTA